MPLSNNAPPSGTFESRKRSAGSQPPERRLYVRKGAFMRLRWCLILAAVVSASAFAQTSGLTVTRLGFDPGGGAVVFELANRGSVAVTQPFRIDVWRDSLHTSVDFVAGKTVGFGLKSSRTVPIQPNEQRRVLIDDLKVDKCSGNHSIKVAINANNQMQRSLDAPCPDLAVVSIEKNYNNLHTEFGADVTITNKGTGTAGRFNVFAVTSNQITGIFNLPDSPYRVYDSLAPGETKKFTVGNALAVESMWVRVVVDMPDWNKELDETNNEMRKTLH
jgi:CARDB protein